MMKALVPRLISGELPHDFAEIQQASFDAIKPSIRPFQTLAQRVRKAVNALAEPVDPIVQGASEMVYALADLIQEFACQLLSVHASMVARPGAVVVRPGHRFWFVVTPPAPPRRRARPAPRSLPCAPRSGSTAPPARSRDARRRRRTPCRVPARSGRP